jgi:hypothetical protein
MTDTAHHAVATALSRLEAAGYRPPWSDSAGKRATAQVWIDVLGDLDPAAILSGVSAWLREGAAFWPVPGQVRALLAGSTLDPWTRCRDALAARPGHAPLPAGVDPPWRLATPGSAEEAARWAALEAAGQPPSRTAFVEAYRAEVRKRASWAATRAHPSMVVLWRRRAAEGHDLTEAQRAAVAPAWHEHADAERAWVEVSALLAEHRTPPAAPGTPEPYRLGGDPRTDAAMWAGVEAAGGLDAVRYAEGRELFEVRRAFLSAYNAAMTRAGQAPRLEAR